MGPQTSVRGGAAVAFEDMAGMQDMKALMRVARNPQPFPGDVGCSGSRARVLRLQP